MEQACIWLTGMPSAGKSTIGLVLHERLWREHGINSVLLDADHIRNPHLGFSEEDRTRNVCEIAERAAHVVKGGGNAIVACIAPTEQMRSQASTVFIQNGLGHPRFVYLRCSQDARELRDSRGLYTKAKRGQIKGLTGYDAPYEEPTWYEAWRTYDTDVQSIDHIVDDMMGDRVKYAVFIGRWSPFHNGHLQIICRALDQGLRPLILVRDSEDAFSVGDRITMIRRVFAGNSKVKVARIDDVEAVLYGRGVGYRVEGYDMPADVESISATAIRELMAKGSDEWKDRVPAAVAQFIDNNCVL